MTIFARVPEIPGKVMEIFVGNTPNKASGSIIVQGKNGTIINSGTELQRSDNVVFITIESATISNETATIPIEAQNVGYHANTGASAILTFVTPINDINEKAVIDENGLTGGLDELFPLHPTVAATWYSAPNDTQVGYEYDGENFTPPSGPTNEELLKAIRIERNSLLAMTDYVVLPDSDATTACKTAFENYRQQLRDFTETCDINNPVWPTMPAYVKA